MKLRQFEILLGAFILLVVFSIATIWLFPPSGEARAKRRMQSLHVGLNTDKVELLHRGENTKQTLRYAFHEDRSAYALSFKQISTYEKANIKQEVETDIDARLVVIKQGEDKPLSFMYDQVKVHIHDGESDIPLSDFDALFSGIALEQFFDPLMGLGQAKTVVKINPQIGRILYFLTDMVRSAWSPLPQEEVGVGAHWVYKEDTLESAHCLLYAGDNRVDSMQGSQVVIQHTAEVSKKPCAQELDKKRRIPLLPKLKKEPQSYGEGMREHTVTLQNSEVVESTGRSTFKSSQDKGSETHRQQLKSSFQIKKIPYVEIQD